MFLAEVLQNRADNSRLGDTLKVARKSAGLNQSELAGLADVGDRTVYQGEQGIGGQTEGAGGSSGTSRNACR